MLNKIQPALYIRLRRHSKLTRKQFATQLDVNRDTLRNYEAGKTRPDLETEQKMLEISQCSDLELAEMLCEITSGELGMRVAIVDGEHDYQPTTSLARARRVRRHYDDQLSDLERRALDNKLHTAHLMQVLIERHNADLDEYATDCRAEAEQRRKRVADARIAGPPNQGATGPASEGTPHGAEPAFDNAAGTPPPHRGAGGGPRQYVRERRT